MDTVTHAVMEGAEPLLIVVVVAWFVGHDEFLYEAVNQHLFVARNADAGEAIG